MMSSVVGPIGLAGAGRIAQALGRLLLDSGEPVVAVASRSTPHAESAAAFVGAGVRALSLAQLPGCAERILIAVPDDALTSVATTLGEVRRVCVQRG